MKIELSLARDYVPSWTIKEAIRELFQNAKDQATQNPGCDMFYHYTDGIFRIGNWHTKLTPKTLLLGNTSKADNENTIGQFGEGYKLATLVLLRNDKQVTFFNFKAEEVWHPRFVKSKRMQADVLTFFIDKEPIWKQMPDDNLVIEVQGITQQEWEEEIVPSILELRNDYTVLHDTTFGQILDLPGKVYVNGLFVCNFDQYKYGYNFKPGQLKLDRDRKLASDFDLKWLASTMWSTLPDALELLEVGAADTAYVMSMVSSRTNQVAELSRRAYDRFVSKYGSNAVPVTTQTEADQVPSGYTPIIVNENYKTAIKRCPDYEEPAITNEQKTPMERLKAWRDKHRLDISCYLSESVIDELNSIIEELEQDER